MIRNNRVHVCRWLSDARRRAPGEDGIDAPTSIRSSPADPPLERIALDVPSSLEGVATLEEAAEALALRASFDEDEASSIAMATREAAINAAKHGNGFDPEKQVKAVLERIEGTVRIAIADQGAGLDPETLPDPLDPANLLRPSGRGVFLIRAIMDEVHFRKLSPGTEITLIKHKLMEAGT